MYQIAVYVPEQDLQTLKNAMFEVGAGAFQNYDSCCWQSKGEGQFRALNGANPTLGEIDEVTKVVEYKVEMICQADKLNAVIEAMKLNHSYEEVAYQVIKLAAI